MTRSIAATVSKKITITFSGTDNIGIASFQCSLDGKPFTSCTSPTTFNNLAFGTHTFKVRVINTAGNTDPTPASFTWTILTPAQGLLKLKSFVNGMQDVSSSSKASLNARLDEALKYLSDSSTVNDRGACTQLDGFIRTANSFARAGNLSPQQTNQIIYTLPYSAQAIKTSLGCT